MRIDQLQLIRYGKFTDQTLTLPRAPRDFHLIVGPNEAGKSTIRSAIHQLLYGFPLRNSGYVFAHPLAELRLGARISHAGHELAFQRIKANKATLRGPDDAPLPDEVLAPLLGGVDPKFFEQMFSLDHTRLVQGGASILSAADEEVGQVLFESAAGIASLGAIRAELEQEADGLWAKRKSAARVYYQAEQAHDAARQVLKAASLRAKDWADAHARVEELDANLQAALAEQARLRARRSVLQRARRVAPLLATLDSASLQRLDYAADPELPDTAAATLDEAERRLAALEVGCAHQRQRRDAAAQALRELQLDTALIALDEEILTLDELRLQYRAYPADLEKRELDVRARWAVISDLAAQLGWDAGLEEAVAARVPSQPSRAALARLARQREALALAQDGAERALRQRTRDVDHARADLERLAQGPVAPTLRTAMARARALGDAAAILRELSAEVATREYELGMAHKALGADTVALDALAAMLPPTREHVQGLLDAQRRDAAEADRLEREWRKVGDQLAEIAAASQGLREQRHPVLLEEVTQARRARDAVWGVMKHDPSTTPVQAERYERLVEQTDALADARHDRAHDAAELRGLEERAAALELEHAALQRELETLRAKRAERDDAWTRLRDECRLPVLSLAAASEWLQARERALQAWQGLAGAKQKLEAFQAAVSQAAAALAAELTSAGQPLADADLAALCMQAEELVRQHDESRGERKSLEQQLGAATRELETLHDAVRRADDHHLAWLGSWRAALADAGFDADADPAKVEASLDIIERIDDGLASVRQIRRERIDTMRADLHALDARARALALRVRPQLAGQAGSDIALALKVALGEARIVEAQVAQARADQAAADDALQRAALDEQGIRAALAALMQRASVSELPLLRTAIERSDARRRLQAMVDEAHKALLDQGDGLSLAALRAESEGLDPGAVMAELAELDAREDAVARRIPELSALHSRAEDEFRTMAGQSDAATAEAKRQESLAQMADAVERYIKVHTASRLLAWSIERYRDARQGPMLAAASTIFARLTLGSFERLMVDFDSQPPTLHGRRPDGAYVGVEGMSEGTRDQLYLALRLAALDMHLRRAHALPFVADDLFVNFDDQRTKAGLESLASLSERSQVLFLTHHDHMLDLVREVYGDAVNIVRLSR